jgi:hypothetical protein
MNKSWKHCEQRYNGPATNQGHPLYEISLHYGIEGPTVQWLIAKKTKEVPLDHHQAIACQL